MRFCAPKLFAIAPLQRSTRPQKLSAMTPAMSRAAIRKRANFVVIALSAAAFARIAREGVIGSL
jgi:hypothetical protein